MNFVILHKLSFVVFVNRNQILLILHYTHCAREVCTQPQMSHIFTYVQVTLATLDLQSILEILATDEIHMEDQYQTWMSTATYFESCGTRTTNGRINLYIKLEKHKLNQIAERNIRISLDKGIALSK